jgi:hypothetical protein
VLAAGDGHGTVWLWQLPSGRPLARHAALEGEVQLVLLGRDSASVLAVAANGAVWAGTTEGRPGAPVAWERRGGCTSQKRVLQATASSPDGGFAALAWAESHAFLERVEHGRGCSDLDYDTEELREETSYRVDLWSFPVADRPVHGYAVPAAPLAVAFSPQDRLMAVGLADGTLQLWALPPGTLSLAAAQPADLEAIRGVLAEESLDQPLRARVEQLARLLEKSGLLEPR